MIQLINYALIRWKLGRGIKRGQTMTEYALILAAVAVVVFVGYKTLGTTITAELTVIDGSL